MTSWLAISGSLRAASCNRALLTRAAHLARPPVEIRLWDGLAAIPAFDPDQDETPPATVNALRKEARSATGLMIGSPEYAHGVAGALKNALDWLVGSGELYGKPICIINASARANIAQAALADTLRTMGADPLIDVSMPVTFESCAAGDADDALYKLLAQLILSLA